MEEYEEEGVSLGQIFKVIFRRWKLLLFITGLIFVFGVLGTQLIYNRLKVNYKTTVVYNVVGLSDGTYSDGSRFNYRDLVKLDALNKVKESNEKYKNIDVEALANKEKISISQNVIQDDTKTVTTVTFSISTKANCFKSVEIATEFMYDVLYAPVAKTIEIEKEANRKSNLTAYNLASTYQNQINYLKNQLNYINEKYNYLISTYGDQQKTLEKRLSEYKQVLNSYFEQNTFDELENELIANNYVKDFNHNKQELEIRRESLVKKISDNQNIIDSLYEQIKRLNGGNDIDVTTLQSSDVFTPYTTQIANLTIANAQMENEISDIDQQIANGGGSAADIQAFNDKLTSYYTKLDTETDLLHERIVTVTTDNVGIDYYGKAIESSGGISLLISALLFLVAGFVVAAIVNLIIDRKYLKEDFRNETKTIVETKEDNKVVEAIDNKDTETKEETKE